MLNDTMTFWLLLLVFILGIVCVALFLMGVNRPGSWTLVRVIGGTSFVLLEAFFSKGVVAGGPRNLPYDFTPVLAGACLGGIAGLACFLATLIPNLHRERGKSELLPPLE